MSLGKTLIKKESIQKFPLCYDGKGYTRVQDLTHALGVDGLLPHKLQQALSPCAVYSDSCM